MFKAPEIMQMASQLARHSGARQSVIASNIANADTPGYRARDLESFSESYARGTTRTGMRTTRDGHLSSNEASVRWAQVDAGGDASPNGNNVSLENEMVRGTRANSNHTLALTVYRASLDILRTTIGRGQ